MTNKNNTMNLSQKEINNVSGGGLINKAGALAGIGIFAGYVVPAISRMNLPAEKRIPLQIMAGAATQFAASWSFSFIACLTTRVAQKIKEKI